VDKVIHITRAMGISYPQVKMLSPLLARLSPFPSKVIHRFWQGKQAKQISSRGLIGQFKEMPFFHSPRVIHISTPSTTTVYYLFIKREKKK
jgi:hypothetical protein